MRRAIGASLRFRLLVVLAAAGLMLVGALRVARMPAASLPEIAPPIVEVQTEAPGLSAAEVEALITVPMEQSLFAGVMGVSDISSDSVPGASSIVLHFTPAFDLLHARQLVQERLTQAFALPNVSKPPVMLQPVSSAGRVMLVGLSPPRGMSFLTLSVLARWTIVPRLLGLPGIANVSTFGQADRQLQVLVDPRSLAAHKLSLAQIVETAGNSQLVSPLTYLQASTPGTGGFLEGPNQRITIRHVLPFGLPADLAQVPIAGVTGHPVPLGRIASVVQDHQPLIGEGSVGGAPALVLVIQKLPGASVTAVTDQVDRALQDLGPAISGVHVDTAAFRPAGYVRESLHNLALAAVIGAALALLATLALFLRLRPAAVSLVAAALSLLAAALVLDLLGYTFNALVATGLLLAVAIVIDDAVGDMHNLMARIRARRTSDSRPAPAAGLVTVAYDELRSALGYATLIVLLSVAPLFFSSGLSARFLHPMVLAFALAVIASMVVALTVTPALAVVLYARPGHEPPRGETFWRLSASAYERALGSLLRAPRLALAALCAVGLCGFVAVPLLAPPAPPTFRDRNLVIHWNGPAGTSLPEMDRMTARVSGLLRALRGVDDVAANVGRAVTADQVVNTNSAELWVTISPGADYDRTLASIRSVLDGTPGMAAVVSTPEADGMAGVLVPSARAVTARIYGHDYPVLAQLATQLRERMSHLHGLRSPQLEMPALQPTLEVHVDLSKAEQNGVKPGDVRREASTLLSGLTVGNFFEQQKVFDVVVRGTPAVQQSLSSVRDLLLDTGGGGHVRLGDVAQVTIQPDPSDIQHQAVSRYIDVSAGVSGRSVGSARDAVSSAARAISFPLEYHAEVLGAGRDPATSHGAFVSYELAAMVGIFLLAQAALASWRLALLVCLLLPVALAGGLLVALVSGQLGSLGSLAGLTVVLGVAARQALGVAARIRRLHEADRGALSTTIVARGAAERAGATIGAALVAASALAPFAVIGDVAGNEISHAAATVVLGGLVSSTLVNLLVLPAVYLKLSSHAAVAEASEVDRLGWASPSTKPTPSDGPR